MNTQDIISNEQVSSLERIAAIVAKSGMGGFKTPEQATVAMLLALAEGIPLGRIIHEYHVINGRLSLRSECMLARFQRAGGIIKYIEHSDVCVSVTASHPKGGALTVTWTLERARKAGLTSNPTWQKHPAAMLTARAIAEAVRAVYPACLSGIITEDEAVEITPSFTPAPTREPIADVVARHGNGAHQLPNELEPVTDEPATVPEPHEYNIDRINDTATTGGLSTRRTRKSKPSPTLDSSEALASEITKRMAELNVPEPVIPAHVAKQPQHKDDDTNDYAEAPEAPEPKPPVPYTPRYANSKSPIADGPLSEILAPFNEQDVNAFMISRGLLHKGQTHRDAQPYVVDRIRNQWESFVTKGNFRPATPSSAMA